MDKLKDTYVATDFFDASINRICAWVIGLRNTRKAILSALLQPVDKMKELEAAGDVSARLAFKEEFKAAPQQQRIGEAHGEQQEVGLPDAPGVARAVVVAGDGLRALRDALKREHGELHGAGERYRRRSGAARH